MIKRNPHSSISSVASRWVAAARFIPPPTPLNYVGLLNRIFPMLVRGAIGHQDQRIIIDSLCLSLCAFATVTNYAATGVSLQHVKLYVHTHRRYGEINLFLIYLINNRLKFNSFLWTTWRSGRLWRSCRFHLVLIYDIYREDFL